MKKNFRKDIAVQFLVLFGLWLLLSGHYDWLHITIGFFSALLVVFIHIPLNRYLFYEKKITKGHVLNYIRLLIYIPWLIWQIIVASLQVAYLVMHPKIPINPILIRFKTQLPNPVAKVILGNSITLTPGTLTISIDEDEFLVHALTEASASSIIDGTMPRQVARLFQKRPSAVVEDVRILKSKKALK